MSGAVYGTIQKIEASGDRLVIRCVRDFFHGDGLMLDDVWIWEIERHEDEKSEMLQSIVGRPIVHFEVSGSGDRQSLCIALDEGHETISLTGKRVGKKEEPRSGADLENVVTQLSQRIFQDEAHYLALSQKLTSVATFVEQKIDRLQRRAEFELQRGSEKKEGFGREIEDLQGILKKLQEPNQAPEPTAPSGRGSS
jgi:hypothetical protein